ncbi:hypothetical protein Ancab_032260 [Ancistrocladus abbreviatus]
MDEHDEVAAPVQPQSHPYPAASLEEFVERSIGHIRAVQVVQAVLISVLSFFDAQQTFISVFTDAQPSWHCTNATICNHNSNICSLPKSAWAWDNERHHHTIISEWDLECSSAFITGLPATSYFAGCVLGGFALATLGDSSLGRKNLLFLSSLLMCIAALCSAFSTDVGMYSTFRFFCGVGRVSITTSALVLLTERVGRRWRSQMGQLLFVFFTAGMLSLPAIAYAGRGSSWRMLYIWTSSPGLLHTIIAYFFVCESPRWLFLQGRISDAIAVLKRIGSADLIGLSSLPNMQNWHENQVQSKTNPFSSIRILFRKRWAVQRLLAVMVLGFSIGLTYFVLLLGVRGLNFNVYLITELNALLTIPSLLIFLFWVQKCNRKSSMLAFCTSAGAFCIVCAIVARTSKGVSIGMELASIFFMSLAYNMFLIYMVELFPTQVRSSTTSLARQAVMVGSVIVPVLTSAGRENKLISYGVSGCLMVISGFLVLCFPETRGRALSNTMEEQELKDSTRLPMR